MDLEDVRINKVLYTPVLDGEYMEGEVGSVIHILKNDETFITAVELKNISSVINGMNLHGGIESFVGKRVRITLAKR